MPDIEHFQTTVDNNLIRHRSILDVLAKLQEATARVNRAVVKSVTSCGCLTVQASRQTVGESLNDARGLAATHLGGELCSTCRDVVETEIGRELFYLVSLCTLLDIDFGKVLEQEDKRVSALGPYILR